MGKLKREKEKLEIFNCKRILGVLFIIIGIACVVQVFLANRAVDMGGRLIAIEEKIAGFERENRNSEKEISEAENLVGIEKKARKLGLAKNTSYFFLTPSNKIAFDNK